MWEYFLYFWRLRGRFGTLLKAFSRDFLVLKSDGRVFALFLPSEEKNAPAPVQSRSASWEIRCVLTAPGTHPSRRQFPRSRRNISPSPSEPSQHVEAVRTSSIRVCCRSFPIILVVSGTAMSRTLLGSAPRLSAHRDRV